MKLPRKATNSGDIFIICITKIDHEALKRKEETEVDVDGEHFI